MPQDTAVFVVHDEHGISEHRVVPEAGGNELIVYLPGYAVYVWVENGDDLLQDVVQVMVNKVI